MQLEKNTNRPDLLTIRMRMCYVEKNSVEPDEKYNLKANNNPL